MTSVPPEPPAGSEPSATPPAPPPPPPSAVPPAPPQPSAAPPPPPAPQAPYAQPGQPAGQQWSTPPAQPGQPGQEWSTPPAQPAQPAARRGSFDPSAADPMDWGILAAGLLAFIFSFVTYYSYSLGPLTRDFSAWDGFFGWFSTLLALLSAVLLAVYLFAPQVTLPPTVRLTVLSGFAMAALFVIIAGFVDSRNISGTGISSSRGVGYYLSLIVILAGGVLAYLRLRATGGKLPWENKT